jgi:hypothetical protein
MRWRSASVFICCALGLVLLLAGVYLGPQTVTYFRLRPLLLSSTDYPPRGWSSIPRPLADTEISTVKVNALSFYGCRFEVPWKEIDKKWDDGQMIRVRFKTGETIQFNNPEYFQKSPINSDSVKDDRDRFGIAFGRGINESKYEQLREVLSATPTQLSPFRSHTEFARVLILLEIKGLWFEHNTAAPDIFSFKTDNYRGFEFSGLSHDWQYVTLNFFDAADHWFQINIKGDERSGVRVTQPEINLIIQSFGPIPPNS